MVCDRRLETRPCPTCKKAIPALPPGQDGNPFRPFCSSRCKTADLGEWLSGRYRISEPLSGEDLDAGVPRGAATDPEDESSDE